MKYINIEAGINRVVPENADDTKLVCSQIESAIDRLHDHTGRWSLLEMEKVMDIDDSGVGFYTPHLKIGDKICVNPRPQPMFLAQREAGGELELWTFLTGSGDSAGAPALVADCLRRFAEKKLIPNPVSLVQHDSKSGMRVFGTYWGQVIYGVKIVDPPYTGESIYAGIRDESLEVEPDDDRDICSRMRVVDLTGQDVAILELLEGGDGYAITVERPKAWDESRPDENAGSSGI